MSDEKYKPETTAIHGGTTFDPATGALQTPIYQTVGYHFQDAQHAADLFNMDQAGHIYSRISNPTVQALEQRITALEGGIGAIATASGIAANVLALFPLMEPGCEFVASSRLYGGTLAQFAHAFKKFGWTCHFVDADTPENFAKVTNERTRAYYCESQSNPLGQVCDVAAIADIAHNHGVPLIVDNTIPTPYLWRPVEWGADMVVHSTTKFLNGHGNAIGGILIDSGKFDWTASDKYPSLITPQPSYHGTIFTDKFAEHAYITYARAVGLRDLGACQAPMDAFLTLEGIESLGVRMDKHVSNAKLIAEFLEAHPKVTDVSYPGLVTSPYHDLVQKYMPRGASALFTFTLASGYEAGMRVVESCELFTHLISLGETHSLISHPASTTHRPLSEEQLKDAGIAPGMIRLAIGLEAPEDLIQDLSQALDRSP